MGRPHVKITPDLLQKAEVLSSHGHDQDQIAVLLGMGVSTFYDKKAKNPELQEAITNGKTKGGAVVASELMKAVKNGSVSAMIWYEKTRMGRTERINVENTGTVTHKHEGVSRSHEILGEFASRGPSQSPENSLPN